MPNYPKDRKKRGIITSLITGFIDLMYKSISSYLHNRRQKALYKAFVAMENKNKKIKKFTTKQNHSFRKFNCNVWYL